MNPFDAGLNGYNIDKMEFNGIGSSLKKVGRKIDKSRRKVLKKTMPKPLYKIQSKVGAEIRRSPIAQVAVVAAASMIFPPAAAALKGVAAKIAASKVGAGAISLAKSSLVKKAIVKKGIATVMERKAKKEGKKSAKKFEARIKDIEKVNESIQNNPKFAAVVEEMLAAGASEQEIIKAWAASDEYKKIALPEVQAIAQDEVYQNLVSAGVPDEQAKMQANIQGAEIAEQAVAEVQEKAGETKGNWLVPLVGAVAAFALFGGA